MIILSTICLLVSFTLFAGVAVLFASFIKNHIWTGHCINI